MKKLILVFVAVAFASLTSCGSDDDGAGSDVDAIVGTWKLTQEFENGELVESDPCDLEDTFTYKEDGTVEEKLFEELTDGSGNCDEGEIETGTWENLGEGEYKFTFGDETYTGTFTFSGNTYTDEYSDTFNGETIEYKDVYTKI